MHRKAEIAAITTVVAAATGGALAAATAVTELGYKRKLSERQRRYRYRPPLYVPIGYVFNLQSFSETWCIEFFRFSPLVIQSLLPYF